MHTLSCTSMFTPPSKRILTTMSNPCKAALCRGVHPYCQTYIQHTSNNRFGLSSRLLVVLGTAIYVHQILYLSIRLAVQKHLDHYLVPLQSSVMQSGTPILSITHCLKLIIVQISIQYVLQLFHLLKIDGLLRYLSPYIRIHLGI